MHFSRLYSFLFCLIALGLFAHAKPIENGLAVREDSGDILARGFPQNPCGCCQDFKDVLLDLKVKINAIVWVDAHKACDDVVAALDAAVALIVKIDLKAPCLIFDVLAIVDIIVNIILVILGGCSKFALGTIADVVATIDVALSLFVKACINLCPLLSVKIALNVTLILNVLLLRLLGFVQLLGCLGL